MILIEIKDVKQLMNKLLIEEAFDKFLLSEANIVSSNSYIIDGHINKSFYTAEELENMRYETEQQGRIFSETMTRFENIKPVCLSLIKGKKTPVSFKFSFYLADENIEKFLKNSNQSLTRNDINGLVMNLKYAEQKLTITTAVSLKVFTLDKSIEKLWDSMVKRFLEANNIAYEEL